MTVNAILNEKGRNVVTANKEDTLSDICAALAQNRIGAIVVVDSDSNVRGIISERDIVRALARHGNDALKKQAAMFMTENVITCSGAETIADLMAKMTKGKFRHLPVVESGKLAGIVSIGDVVKWRIAEAEFEARAMREYIATG